MRRVASVEWLSILPRTGAQPVRRVTETQARSLMALALVDPMYRNRRRNEVIAVRVRLGVSVAAINAALRVGIGARLPIAEDNRTVVRTMPTTWEPAHVSAWADGRECKC